MKKRPSNSETGRKRAGSQSGGGVGPVVQTGPSSTVGPTVLHNGTDTATFLKPDALPGFSQQEYYEADEILKVTLFYDIVLL